jgi:hypothetical protein
MVTEGMVYCFNGLGKNGLEKFKVKEVMIMRLRIYLF